MRIASDRYRTAENSLLTKHVVAAGLFAKDAGSTPAASTIYLLTSNVISESSDSALFIDFHGEFEVHGWDHRVEAK